MQRFCLTVPFQVRLLQVRTVNKTKLLRIVEAELLQADALPVTQPTVSKH